MKEQELTGLIVKRQFRGKEKCNQHQRDKYQEKEIDIDKKCNE